VDVRADELDAASEATCEKGAGDGGVRVALRPPVEVVQRNGNPEDRSRIVAVLRSGGEGLGLDDMDLPPSLDDLS